MPPFRSGDKLLNIHTQKPLLWKSEAVYFPRKGGGGLEAREGVSRVAGRVLVLDLRCLQGTLSILYNNNNNMTIDVHLFHVSVLCFIL